MRWFTVEDLQRNDGEARLRDAGHADHRLATLDAGLGDLALPHAQLLGHVHARHARRAFGEVPAVGQQHGERDIEGLARLHARLHALPALGAGEHGAGAGAEAAAGALLGAEHADAEVRAAAAAGEVLVGGAVAVVVVAVAALGHGRHAAVTATPGAIGAGLGARHAGAHVGAAGPRVAVGAGARDDDGDRIALDVKAGDKILFGKWSGTEIKLDGEDLLIMKESDILGIMA